MKDGFACLKEFDNVVFCTCTDENPRKQHVMKLREWILVFNVFINMSKDFTRDILYSLNTAHTSLLMKEKQTKWHFVLPMTAVG